MVADTQNYEPFKLREMTITIPENLKTILILVMKMH